MTDCMIIGSGLAGISAALTLKANGKTVQIFGVKSLSDKIAKAEKIQNYPALSSITGKAFVAALQSQLSDMEIAVTEEKVIGVYALNGKFGVATQEGGYHEGKTVLLACGVEAVKSFKGETEFAGRGVSFCATCDGALYKNKTIAVFCTSKKLEHEIGDLSDFAKKVYLIAMYNDVEIERENVEIIRKMPVEVTGGSRVEKLIFKDSELQIDGLFSLRESVFPSTLVNGLETENGHVKVDRHMQTNIAGLFAAGDCTGRPYQYAKAAGEGNVAAHAVSEYLSVKGN
ncbi:MAG: FAD-dependent oxidoreductase [Clostridia bacterium]|nr:FAD-dependent oxidoreductase [Clostridia bacterium]